MSNKKETGFFDKCTKCGTYHLTNETCPETYFVCCPEETGEEENTVKARSFADAAEQFAKHLNQDNCFIGDSVFENVRITNKDRTESKYFSASAEVEINYYITEIKGEGK